MCIISSAPVHPPIDNGYTPSITHLSAVHAVVGDHVHYPAQPVSKTTTGSRLTTERFKEREYGSVSDGQTSQ